MRKPKKTDKTAPVRAGEAASPAPERENRSVFFGFLRFSPEAQLTLGQKDNNINREKTSLFLYTPLALRLRVRGGVADFIGFLPPAVGPPRRSAHEMARERVGFGHTVC